MPAGVRGYLYNMKGYATNRISHKDLLYIQ